MFVKPKRNVNKIFIHCSDSDIQAHDNVNTIRKWHLARGFKDIGYHYIILKNGKIEIGRNNEVVPSAQKGYNTNSIAICLTGSKEFTDMQFEALKEFCNDINQQYDKQITFHGHCEVDSGKTCPVFDYKKVLNLNDKGYILL